MALMGDPSLRMHAVSPPANLQGTATAAGMSLTWTASSSALLQGYHVYRAATASGPFTRLTLQPLTGTGFVDAAAPRGTYTYMVRAIKLENSASGSYFNPSQGVFATVDVEGTVSPPIPSPIQGSPPLPPVGNLPGGNGGFPNLLPVTPPEPKPVSTTPASTPLRDLLVRDAAPSKPADTTPAPTPATTPLSLSELLGRLKGGN